MRAPSRLIPCSKAATLLAVSLHAVSALAQTPAGQGAPQDDSLDSLLSDTAPEPSPPATAAETPVSEAPTPVTAAPSAAPLQTIPVAEAATPTEPVAAEKTVKPKSSNRFIEEIVVTAQKREENLQDVPISVQAFSADLLDAKGIDEPKALQLSTPGLQYNVFAGYSLIYIRGVGTDAFIPSADASVATYIDNVYYPFGHSLASSLGSIERVEVLKGPQGTLFGRNSTGGAINIVTKQPGQELKADLLVSRESFDKTNVRGYANIPLVDSLAISVAGLSYTESSYYSLAPTSGRARPLPNETSRALTSKLGWEPLDDLKATIGYTYINSRGAFPMSLAVDTVRPLGTATGVVRQPDYVTGEDAPTYIDTVARIITTDIKYSTPWFDTRLIGGDQRIKSPALADYDGSAQPLASFESLGQFADVKTGEFQVLSNDRDWDLPWLKWIGGIYYINSSAGYDPLLFSLGANTLAFLPQLSPLVTGLTNIVSATGIPLTTLVNGGVTLNLQGVLDTKSTAYFAQATAEISERFALTLGGRYQSERRRLVKSTTRFVPNPDNPYDVVPVLDFGPREENSYNFSPKAVLDFKPAEGHLTYLSYSKGFKSGTFNIIAIYAPTQYVEPEEVSSIELGYKGEFLNGGLRFNAAVFQNSIDNLQVQTISLTSGGAVRFETAGSARVRGADFDVLWQVFPEALPGLIFTAGGAYLDGKYTDFREGSGYDEVTGLYFDGSTLLNPVRDFTGNKTVRTPEFSGNLGLGYTMDVGNGTFEVASDVYYNSGSFFTAQNIASSEEKAYELINVRASYLYNPWDVRITAFGKNINDAKYHYVRADLDFGSAAVLAPPATYGVKLQWQFR